MLIDIVDAWLYATEMRFIADVMRVCKVWLIYLESLFEFKVYWNLLVSSDIDAFLGYQICSKACICTQLVVHIIDVQVSEY